jgi:hypothetical protein
MLASFPSVGIQARRKRSKRWSGGCVSWGVRKRVGLTTEAWRFWSMFLDACPGDAEAMARGEAVQ